MIALALLALTPQQNALQTLAAQDLRVASIGARLARAGGEALCPGQHLSTAGLVIQDSAQYSAATRADAQAVLRLGDGPTVIGTVEGAGQGAQPGDVIAAVNGMRIAVRPTAGPYARVRQVEDAIEQAAGAAIALDVVRSETASRIAQPSISGCRSRFQVVRGGLRATQADGSYVQLSEAMLGLADSVPGAEDNALAAVLAHELAHNILRHTALDTPSKRSEYEADRLSVWLVARAGYRLDMVLPFWEALRKRSDYGIFADGSHPGWKKRLAALAAAVAEVGAQQASGRPLVPPL